MISKIAEKAVDKLFNCGEISSDDKELYVYGFFMLFSKIFYFLLTAIYGLIFGIVLESITFYLTFVLIRGYAGGVHASSEINCTIATSSLLLVCIYLIRVQILSNIMVIPAVVLLISMISIAFLCPIDSPEKRLDRETRKEYKKKSLLSLCVILFLAIFALILGWRGGFYACVTCVLFETILLISAYIKSSSKNDSGHSTQNNTK